MNAIIVLHYILDLFKKRRDYTRKAARTINYPTKQLEISLSQWQGLFYSPREASDMVKKGILPW